MNEYFQYNVFHDAFYGFALVAILTSLMLCINLFVSASFSRNVSIKRCILESSVIPLLLSAYILNYSIKNEETLYSFIQEWKNSKSASSFVAGDRFYMTLSPSDAMDLHGNNISVNGDSRNIPINAAYGLGIITGEIDVTPSKLKRTSPFLLSLFIGLGSASFLTSLFLAFRKPSK